MVKQTPALPALHTVAPLTPCQTWHANSGILLCGVYVSRGRRPVYPASLPAQLRRPSTTIKAITCQATIGSCHEAASLLMAYCDCLDGLAPPQGLHQIYIFLPCTSMQLLCMCVMCFSAQQISANADPPCLHFSCSLSASQLEGGMHVRTGRPLLHSNCWIPEEKAWGNTLPGSAKMRVTPSFSRAATKRSEALVSCPISVMSTPSCTAVVHAIHG